MPWFPGKSHTFLHWGFESFFSSRVIIDQSRGWPSHQTPPRSILPAWTAPSRSGTELQVRKKVALIQYFFFLTKNPMTSWPFFFQARTIESRAKVTGTRSRASSSRKTRFTPWASMTRWKALVRRGFLCPILWLAHCTSLGERKDDLILHKSNIDNKKSAVTI